MTVAQIDKLFQIKIRLTGSDVCRMMRKAGVTIRQLSKKMGITQKRIRQVRNCDGVILTGHTAVDWQEHIDGKMSDQARKLYDLRNEAMNA